MKKRNFKSFKSFGEIFPAEQGVYLVRGTFGDHEREMEIDVYRHHVKGLCCFQEDFGSGGSKVNDKYDCHVSVQFTGLTFIKKLRELGEN